MQQLDLQKCVLVCSLASQLQHLQHSISQQTISFCLSCNNTQLVQSSGCDFCQRALRDVIAALLPATGTIAEQQRETACQLA